VVLSRSTVRKEIRRSKKKIGKKLNSRRDCKGGSAEALLGLTNRKQEALRMGGGESGRDAAGTKQGAQTQKQSWNSANTENAGYRRKKKGNGKIGQSRQREKQAVVGGKGLFRTSEIAEKSLQYLRRREETIHTEGGSGRQGCGTHRHPKLNPKKYGEVVLETVEDKRGKMVRGGGGGKNTTKGGIMRETINERARRKKQGAQGWIQTEFVRERRADLLNRRG